MFDEMRETLLVISLCCRPEVDGHAHKHLILGALVGANGVAQTIGEPPVNDTGVRFEVRCLGIPRRGAFRTVDFRSLLRRSGHSGCAYKTGSRRQYT